jgi:C-terminal processing protease CtpA/Prc
MEFANVLTSFQDMRSTIRPDTFIMRNGLVGNQLLSRLDVMIDYRTETIYLKPRSRYKRTFKMDRSGMILFATGANLDQFIISGLIEDSPAANCGLRVGDKIVRVQGLPSRFYSLDQLTRVMQKREGKRIRINVERNGLVYKYTFRLRSLI